MIEILSKVLAGVVAGCTFSISSYWKKKDQVFEWKKLAVTGLFGALSGVLVAFTGWDMEMSTQLLTQAGITPLLENLWKIVYRKVSVFLVKIGF